MNKILCKENKNRNKHKIALKLSPKDNKLQKELKINDFNIIELNEEEISPEYEPDINIFSEREIQRLKKKATSIEEYYSNKSEDANINENCFNCLMSNFKPNELLYFSKRKDLLTYLKYCFYFLKNILFLDNQIYIENRYELDKCDTNYLNGWKFFIPKTVCRACFLQIINTEHLFGNLKTIFSDIDPNTVSKNVHRNRSHFNSRSRNSHSLHRNSISRNNNINENGKNKIIIPEKESNKIKIKNTKYNTKNNNNISYDDKNGLISIKKDILGEVGNMVNKKEENGKKPKNQNNKIISELNNELNNQNDEQSVTEIKIKASDFIGEGNISDNESKKEKNKENKNKESIINDEIKINKKNTNNKASNNNYLKINNSKASNNSLNNTSINEIIIKNAKKKNNENESKEDILNNNINKNKKNMNICNEILNIKFMSNEVVIKLHYKLNVFKDILLYTIINIGDFKEKLINSMHFNPNIISYGINQYEQYFLSLYNEGFKAKKEYEEMFRKIKIESIPSISRNLLKLKEEKIEDNERKYLDEMENYLKEYSERIGEMEKKYDETMNIFFANFYYFFSVVKELKTAFGDQNY